MHIDSAKIRAPFKIFLWKSCLPCKTCAPSSTTTTGMLVPSLAANRARDSPAVLWEPVSGQPPAATRWAPGNRCPYRDRQSPFQFSNPSCLGRIPSMSRHHSRTLEFLGGVEPLGPPAATDLLSSFESRIESPALARVSGLSPLEAQQEQKTSSLVRL